MTWSEIQICLINALWKRKRLQMCSGYDNITHRGYPRPCFPVIRKAKRPKGGKNMNKYELALVVSAKLDDEAREAVVEKAKGYITQEGGVIGEIDAWGKKRLAYEIQKQREGFYYFIPFEAEPTVPAELERNCRIMDNVLRYLIVRPDAK